MSSTERTPPALALSRTRASVGKAWLERGITFILLACASVAAIATLAILFTMLQSSWGFFSGVSLREFFFGTVWAPDFIPRQYGSLPLLLGTFKIAVGAAMIGVPLGVGAALYLSEFATQRARSILKPAIEILAGIPSIVFGIVALFVIGPFLKGTYHVTPWWTIEIGLFSALSAAIALGIMVIPIIATIAEDALRAVPRELREGALALGATKWESTWTVTLPAARSGVTAAIILGFSRAIGETMAVTLAAGLVPSMSLSLFDPAQTVTAFIANRAGGDLPTGSVEYLSIFALGAVLFVITFAINLVAEFTMARYRKRFAT